MNEDVAHANPIGRAPDGVAPVEVRLAEVCQIGLKVQGLVFTVASKWPRRRQMHLDEKERRVKAQSGIIDDASARHSAELLEMIPAVVTKGHEQRAFTKIVHSEMR